MDTIKTMIGDEPQENSANDGIYDGASTTPEGTEEAVTPKADAYKAEEASRDETMGDAAVENLSNRIEVVEGESDVVGGVLAPQKGITVEAAGGETKGE